MGFSLSDLSKALDDFGRKHKEHMTSQWEKQAENAKAAEPRPLTETQLIWQQLQRERAEQQQHLPAQQHQPAVSQEQRAAVATTPVYTITWKVRLTGTGNLPLPWATN